MNVYRNLFIWLIIGVMMILLFNLFSTPKKTEQEIIFSEFMTRLEGGDVEEVTIKGNNITGQLRGGKKFKTYTAEYPDLVEILRSKNVKIIAQPGILFLWLSDNLYIFRT